MHYHQNSLNTLHIDRSLSRSSSSSSTSYYNMHYHQNNLNILHIDSSEIAHIPKNVTLKTDTAQDSQTVLLTTLHFKTSSSQTTARVQIDTDAQGSTTPLIISKRCFPTKSTASTLTKDILLPTERTGIGQWIPQKFLGQIIVDVHHKTAGRSYLAMFFSSKIPLAL